MEYAVEISNVRKSFGEKEVLKGIDLRISAGEIFGLLGPSGAGKTTLIKILTGQLKRISGRAVIMGKDAGKLDGVDYGRMGMMMDNLGLYERLSCYDNLKLFTRIYRIDTGQIDRALDRVGLLEAKKVPAMKLSKGMKGRLALARALMHEPKLLFLDEPSSGLDPGAAAQIHHLIQEEREKGTTIFLTTHNMEEAKKLCDHIALLNEGEIVEYGNPDDICRKYNHDQKLVIRLCDGKQVELVNGRESAEEISRYLKVGMMETIHSTEPDLEMVFMELTGRGLNR